MPICVCPDLFFQDRLPVSIHNLKADFLTKSRRCSLFNPGLQSHIRVSQVQIQQGSDLQSAGAEIVPVEVNQRQAKNPHCPIETAVESKISLLRIDAVTVPILAGNNDFQCLCLQKLLRDINSKSRKAILMMAFARPIDIDLRRIGRSLKFQVDAAILV